MEEGTTIEAALDRAEVLRPHFVHVLRQLYPIKVEHLEGITADRYCRLYYDPEILLQWEVDWAATRILVIVEHYFRRHGQRQGKRGELLWNVAAELAVISSFQYENLKIPPGTLDPESFKLKDGLTAEEYYTLLLERCGKRKEEIRTMIEEANKNPPPFGSAATADLLEWEIPEDEAPAIDRLAAIMLQQEMLEGLTEAGVAPGNRTLDAPDDRESNVDYRVKLRGMIGSVLSNRPGMEDWSYLVPDSDFGIYGNVVNPGLVGRSANLGLVIDTSSSMGVERLSQAIAEVGGVLRTLDNAEGVFVYTCDSAVHDAKQVFNRHQVTLIGGGGTNMGVGIKAAVTRHPKPDVVIVITDGYTEWPKKAPRGTPVIVVLVDSGTCKPPGWAHAVIKVPV